jgi:dTDP-4-dehydrorhamnose reductase
VARKTEQILLSRAGPSGVYHLVPAGEASRYEFARALATALGATVSIVEATSSEYRLPATRPRYSAMSSAYAARVFGVDVPGWESLLSLGFPDLGGRAAH